MRPHRKIVIAAWPYVMPLSKQSNDLLLCCWDLGRIADLHIDVAQSGAADHAFHRARVRHHDDVVLIHTLRTQPLGREHASDREWHIFDT